MIKAQRKSRGYYWFIPVRIKARHWRRIYTWPREGWRFGDGHPVDLTKMEFARGRGAVRRVFAREKL